MIKRLLIALVTLFTTTIYAQNDTIKLNDVSITSQRFKLEASSSKTIQMDSVKTYFSQETPYFFSKTPSIVAQSDNGTPFGYSYFTLRGMGQNRINYTLNGVPLNDGEDLAVYTSNYTDLLNSLRSVQIIRGAGVSANGSSSYVGLVNMDLTSPFDKKSVEYSNMIGSFNSHKNSFKFNSGLSKKGLGATFRLSETYTDGFRDFSSGKSFSFSGSVGYHTNVTSIRFNTVFGRTQNGQAWLPVPEGLPVTTNVLVTYGGRPQYDNFTSGIYQLQVTGKFSEVSIFNLSTYFTHVDGNYDFPGVTSIQNLKLDSKNWGMYFNVKHSQHGFTIEPGVTINSFDRQHTGSTEGFVDYTNTGTKFDATAFTKVSYKLGLDIVIEGDYQLRNTTLNYLKDNLTFNGKLFEYNFHNYSFGISYQRSDIFHPYISFGKSSREPSRTNLFGMNDNPTTYDQITNVNPETVRDLELGTKIKSKYVNGSFNFYSMSFENEIIPIGQLNSMGIALGTNAQKSNRLGIEGDLKSDIKKLEVGTSFNISKNKIWLNDTKSDPVLTPNFVSNIYTSYKLDKVELGVNYKYVIKSYLDNENNFVCPEYHLVDTSIIYNTNKNLTFKLFVNNILNRNWTTGGITDGTTRSFYYTAGTNYYLTLNYKF
jgi:iron complex outermembrane receptor protein